MEAKAERRWRDNALGLTERYLAEGVPDRAVTRDLPNRIDVPVPGYEGKIKAPADVTDLEEELFERARKNPDTLFSCAKAKRQQQLRRGVID